MYVKVSHLKTAKPPYKYSAKLKDKQLRKKEGGKKGGEEEKEWERRERQGGREEGRKSLNVQRI